MPAWITPTRVAVDPNAAIVARNSALGAVVALLLGLVGAVIGSSIWSLAWRFW
jgi:uncharacterized membrane protein YeaQ/YmgE (transglycosylase-associated protein family)